MGAFQRRIGRLSRRQAGWTLVELMVVVALLAVVLTAVLSLLDTSAKLAPQDQERGLSMREAQVGLHRMTTELRTAYQIDTSTSGPYYLSALVHTRGGEKQVAYDCAGAGAVSTWGQCIRTDLTPGATSPSVLVKAIVNKPGTGPPVFTYTYRNGKISYVNVHTDIPVRKDTNGKYRYSVPLDDGAYLRNLDG